MSLAIGFQMFILNWYNKFKIVLITISQTLSSKDILIQYKSSINILIQYKVMSVYTYSHKFNIILIDLLKSDGAIVYKQK